MSKLAHSHQPSMDALDVERARADGNVDLLPRRKFMVTAWIWDLEEAGYTTPIADTIAALDETDARRIMRESYPEEYYNIHKIHVVSMEEVEMWGRREHAARMQEAGE